MIIPADMEALFKEEREAWGEVERFVSTLADEQQVTFYRLLILHSKAVIRRMQSMANGARHA